MRYSTAVLAFLSLITTANGMNSFVFTESWLGYLGSFAIQSILAVFSLLLCRFYVQITMLSWQKYIKRLVSGLLTLFFVIALIISSIFSYTYIANNAYSGNWVNDSEFIIQKYLTYTVYQMQKKNNDIGQELLDNITQNASNQLRPAMEKAYHNEINHIEEKIQRILNGIVGDNFKRNAVNINANHLYSSNVDNNNMLDSLLSTYNTGFKQKYIKSLEHYNQIIKKVDIWKNNYKDIINNDNIVEKTLKDVKSEKRMLNKLNKTIENTWESFQFQKDLGSLRSKFQTATDDLKEGYEILHEDLKSLNKLIKELNNTSNLTTPQKLDNILSQIYLLGTNSNIKLDDIIKQITEQSIMLTENGNFSSKEIHNFMILKDNLQKYKNYLDLDDNLDDFRNNNVNKTYEIINKKSMNSWIRYRSQDFKTLFTYLNIFDDYEEMKKMLDTGTNYQRDLLGNLTDFEKAFNYFKYEFPLMACFSLFIAVFFDLGAFLTGCFLYCTDFFKKFSSECKSESSNYDRNDNIGKN